MFTQPQQEIFFLHVVPLPRVAFSAHIFVLISHCASYEAIFSTIEFWITQQFLSVAQIDSNSYLGSFFNCLKSKPKSIGCVFVSVTEVNNNSSFSIYCLLCLQWNQLHFVRTVYVCCVSVYWVFCMSNSKASMLAYWYIVNSWCAANNVMGWEVPKMRMRNLCSSTCFTFYLSSLIYTSN